MGKRAAIYVLKNFKKLLSTIVLSVVVVSLISTLVYLYSTVDSRTSNINYSRRNYILSDDIKYGDTMFDNQSDEGISLDVSELYELITSKQGLQAYTIDVSYMSGLMLIDSNVYSRIKIANDEKEIDFYMGKHTLLEGGFTPSGILVSETYALENNVGVGDKVRIGNHFLVDYSNVDWEKEGELVGIKYLYEKSVEISGIYAAANDMPGNAASTMPTAKMAEDTVYLPIDLYNSIKLEVIEESKKHLDNMEIYIPENLGANDIDRILVQYDNEESASEVDQYIIDNFEDSYNIINSSEEITKAISPLSDFKSNIILITVFATIVSMISMYLNMYLKFEKRRKEYISLMSFGISNVKIAIQTFIEQIILIAISLPFAFLIIRQVVPSIVDVVQRYFIVVLNNGVNETSTNYMYMEFDYLSVNVGDLVNFIEPSLIICFVIGIAVVVISTLALCFLEVFRRFKSFQRV